MKLWKASVALSCLALIASVAMATSTTKSGCCKWEYPSVDKCGCINYCKTSCGIFKTVLDCKCKTYCDTGSCNVCNESCRDQCYSGLTDSHQCVKSVVKTCCDYWCYKGKCCSDKKKCYYKVTKSGCASVCVAGTYQ